MPIGALRFAPVLGRHIPSPFGRLLRMPTVPFRAFADPPFAMTENLDAARALVAAARNRLSQPVNVVAPGAITALLAARRGRRMPLPVIGPEWRLVTGINHLAGAPIPDHVVETLSRGRLADNSRMEELLGIVPEYTTTDVIDQLYGWPSVIRREPRVKVA